MRDFLSRRREVFSGRRESAHVDVYGAPSGKKLFDLKLFAGAR